MHWLMNAKLSRRNAQEESTIHKGNQRRQLFSKDPRAERRVYLAPKITDIQETIRTSINVFV